MKDTELCRSLEIEISVLELWVEHRWLVPEEQEGTRTFHDADLARARLIQDLVGPMGVNEDGVDIAMQLLDQIHGLRSKLGILMNAIRSQDEDIQRRILALLDKDPSA
ncbi:chaperone modulator CbpM [Mycoplana rhizolycopersici]|jgi:chaperone modulatory protein CbpM|uniref:MerR family transcriptional regulator n=1 Tax=Mycoplana rhizolycopersici TaxID=2746702 RepID=A0ABX2QJS7_9HYPH|nr:chaperone modulator CbpM [Rhizobium rhizolycopersici]NVP58012.1 MerR family transcriptional regulator [Rhizobium rhizolycopersici]